MQTFLPYPDFRASAACLDNRRLGKQRVETLQILNALTGRSKGWTQHPATLMWAGYERVLCDYGFAICQEWTNERFFFDTCAYQIGLIYQTLPLPKQVGNPPWLGDPAFHLSHQSNLIRKDPAHYAPLFPGVPDNLRYVWPTQQGVAA